MSDELDRADVGRVLAGDVEAFSGIVQRWQRPLVNLAWRFCHDRDRAEEMAQEAFLRAYRGLRHWRGDGAFSSWLFALALNVYRTALGRLPERDAPEEMLARLTAADDVAADAESREREREVRRAVRTLPARYREALVLFYFCEMDLAAAASRLGVPEGTLKARLHRGRAMLRQRLHVVGPRGVVVEAL